MMTTGDAPPTMPFEPEGEGTDPESLIGERLGAYRLDEILGRGGFGVVYRAEQMDPVQRTVAFKVIRPGMDSSQVMRRFEAERQALALMSHDHVAKVFDAGTTPRGRPFFVMEYVEGRPLTEHCDETSLSIEQRLTLFTQVCDAIQHAHAKGIVHRDIKPGNVLVTPDGTVKVIDFGIAKALDRKLIDETIATGPGQLIGTPEYMSPEQVDLRSPDIDTRSDVYSLGVLLYELLTGTLPFDADSLRVASLAEMQRIIREVDPPKPSTRLSSIVDEAESSRLAAARRVDWGALRRGLRGDLDWIVMRAMEKDRDRRYETPSALAADLHRHLHHQPVAAGPPDARYRIAKFVRRHRTGVVLASAVALTLCAGLATTAWQAERANRQLEQSRLNEREAMTAASILDEMIRGFDETLSRSQESMLSRMIERAEEASLRPQVGEGAMAILNAALGAALMDVGSFDQARARLEPALRTFESRLGPSSPESLQVRNDLAVLSHREGRTDEALTSLRALATDAKEALGVESRQRREIERNVVAILLEVDQVDDALAMLETIDATPTMLGLRAEALRRRFERAPTDESLEAAREAFALAIERLENAAGPEDPETLSLRHNEAALRFESGDVEGAHDAFESVVESRARILGASHPETLVSESYLARVRLERGDLDGAHDLARRVLERQREELAEGHPDTLATMEVLGTLQVLRGDLQDADSTFEHLVEARTETLTIDHPETLNAMNSLAVVRFRLDRRDEAIDLWSEITSRVGSVLSPDDPLALRAEAYLEQARR